MTKPFSDPLSGVVRRCPPVSPTGQDRTGQDTNPPTPRGGTSRERSASNRKRDVDGRADQARANRLAAVEWARTHLPDESPFMAGMAAQMLKRSGTSITPENVKARLVSQGRDRASLGMGD